MNEGLIIDDAEDYAFYQSGLSADGCLEKLDDYTRKAIKRYGEILLEKQKEQIKILEETMEKYKNIPIQRRLSKNDISTSVVRLSDREVFTKDNTDQRFYYIDKESLTKKYYTFEEVQKFIDHGLFAVLKHSNDPMWQKPLSTSTSFPTTHD